MSNQKGLSLLELMIAVAIVAIVVTLGAPAISDVQRGAALSGAVENVYFGMQQARSHAVRQSSDIQVDFTAGQNWCIGTTDQTDCDCAVANSCTVDGVENVLRAQDFPGITLPALAFGTDNQTTFDGTRGLTLNNSGSASFSNGTDTVRINLNEVGRVHICVVSGELGDYPPCAS